MAASCILGQLDIHSGHHDFLSPPQMSPLHWAVDGGHVHIVKFLIEIGADVNCKDDDGVSECDCTTDCGSVRVNLVPKYLHWYPVLILCN